jgi:hypothetical protein
MTDFVQSILQDSYPKNRPIRPIFSVALEGISYSMFLGQKGCILKECSRLDVAPSVICHEKIITLNSLALIKRAVQVIWIR